MNKYAEQIGIYIHELSHQLNYSSRLIYWSVAMKKYHIKHGYDQGICTWNERASQITLTSISTLFCADVNFKRLAITFLVVVCVFFHSLFLQFRVNMHAAFLCSMPFFQMCVCFCFFYFENWPLLCVFIFNLPLTWLVIADAWCQFK